jgi:purine-binding chemotaxis protein CheW
MIELLSIQVADLEFGLELSAVKEVIRPPAIVKVPNLPGFVSGVINFRGVAIPVVDLGTRFETGTKDKGPTAEAGAIAARRLVICGVGT